MIHRSLFITVQMTMSALVQVNVWHQTDDKPSLTEQWIDRFTDAYASPCFNELTHKGRDKTATVLQTTFSYAFSWIKEYVFRIKFHWTLFLKVQLTICQHWFRLSDNGLVLNRLQAIILRNDRLLYWHIYASLGLDELSKGHRCWCRNNQTWFLERNNEIIRFKVQLCTRVVKWLCWLHALPDHQLLWYGLW